MGTLERNGSARDSPALEKKGGKLNERYCLLAITFHHPVGIYVFKISFKTCKICMVRNTTTLLVLSSKVFKNCKRIQILRLNNFIDILISSGFPECTEDINVGDDELLL